MAISAASPASFDAVVLATDHDGFNYSLIEIGSKLLIDTRGRFAPDHHIVRADHQATGMLHSIVLIIDRPSALPGGLWAD